MKTYTFEALGTISLHTIVKANSIEEARRIAEERYITTLCHQCGGNGNIEWATSGELDCTPDIQNVTEE